MSAARTRGILGVLTSGDVARSSGRRRARSRSTSSSPSPDPTFPAQWSPSASRRPRTSAPSFALRPDPRVYPTIGKSSSARSLSFCHSGVRRPGRYGASARFATTPSSPCALAASRSAAPSSNAGDSRTASTEGSRSSSSIRRRSSSGRPTTGRSSSSSRSNAISTSLPDPDWSVSNRAAPASSSAHTSPSITAEGERTAWTTARAISRKRSVRSLPLRLVSVASPPRTATIAR